MHKNFVQTKLIGFFLSQDSFRILTLSLLRFINRPALRAMPFAIFRHSLNVSLSSVDSKATCWSLPISFQFAFQRTRTLRTREVIKHAIFTFFCKLFLLPTLCVCNFQSHYFKKVWNLQVPCDHLYFIKNIYFTTRLAFRHFHSFYLLVSVYLSRPTILSALNMIGIFQNKRWLLI